jgi:uncharacterized Zn finger protein
MPTAPEGGERGGRRRYNAAYQEAYELLLKVRRLMRRLDREQEFDEYLELLRAEYKRKRNFMKLLNRMA